MASRKAAGSTVRTSSGPTTVKAPSIASSGRWSIQLMLTPSITLIGLYVPKRPVTKKCPAERGTFAQEAVRMRYLLLGALGALEGDFDAGGPPWPLEAGGAASLLRPPCPVVDGGAPFFWAPLPCLDPGDGSLPWPLVEGLDGCGPPWPLARLLSSIGCLPEGCAPSWPRPVVAGCEPEGALILSETPSAATVRASIRPLTEMPSLRWNCTSAA